MHAESEEGSEGRGSGSESDDDVEDDQLLRMKTMFKRGRLIRTVGAHVSVTSERAQTIRVRARCLSSLTITADDTSIWLGDVNGSVYHCDVKSSKMKTLLSEPRSAVLCMAVNETATLLATGHQDATIRIWDTRTHKPLEPLPKSFPHRGPIYGLSFRKNNNELLSCSADRSVKVWSVDDMAYMRTLYGHYSAVLGVDCLYLPRAATVSDDKTPRTWKFEEDKTLAYGTQAACLDSVAMLNEKFFATGGVDGTVAVYSVDKKNPSASRPHAHGFQMPPFAAVMTLQKRPGAGGGSRRQNRRKRRRNNAAANKQEGEESSDNDSDNQEEGQAKKERGAGEQAKERKTNPTTGSTNKTQSPNQQQQQQHQSPASALAFGSALEKDLAKFAAEHPTEATSASSILANSRSFDNPNWITSIGAARCTDLFASGSCDGVVRVWHHDRSVLRAAGTFPAAGFVNGIAFAHDMNFMAACAGPHHRLGRWMAGVGAGNQNHLVICPIEFGIDINDLSNFVKDSAPKELTPLPPSDLLRNVKKLVTTKEYNKARYGTKRARGTK